MAILRNVRQQNDATREEIRRTAAAFRGNMLGYAWLLSGLTQRQLDPLGGILAELACVPEQDGDLYSGYWLTTDERFYRFEILVTRQAPVTAQVEKWEEATAGVEVKPRQPGTGKSFGFIAIEVLRECEE